MKITDKYTISEGWLWNF